MKLHELNNRADWNSGIRGLMRFPESHPTRLHLVGKDMVIQIADKIVARIKTQRRI